MHATGGHGSMHISVCLLLHAGSVTAVLHHTTQLQLLQLHACESCERKTAVPRRPGALARSACLPLVLPGLALLAGVKSTPGRSGVSAQARGRAACPSYLPVAVFPCCAYCLGHAARAR